MRASCTIYHLPFGFDHRVPPPWRNRWNPIRIDAHFEISRMFLRLVDSVLGTLCVHGERRSTSTDTNPLFWYTYWPISRTCVSVLIYSLDTVQCSFVSIPPPAIEFAAKETQIRLVEERRVRPLGACECEIEIEKTRFTQNCNCTTFGRQHASCIHTSGDDRRRSRRRRRRRQTHSNWYMVSFIGFCLWKLNCYLSPVRPIA